MIKKKVIKLRSKVGGSNNFTLWVRKSEKIT